MTRVARRSFGGAAQHPRTQLGRTKGLGAAGLETRACGALWLSHPYPPEPPPLPLGDAPQRRPPPKANDVLARRDFEVGQAAGVAQDAPVQHKFRQEGAPAAAASVAATAARQVAGGVVARATRNQTSASATALVLTGAVVRSRRQHELGPVLRHCDLDVVHLQAARANPSL